MFFFLKNAKSAAELETSTVPVGKVLCGTNEQVVRDELIQRVTIFGTVLLIRPVRVLVNNCFFH